MTKFTDYSKEEIKIFKKLSTPKRIQDFLDSLAINFEEKGETVYSPRMVLKHKKAHCMEGAMFAAAVLEFHGDQPLVMDLRTAGRDDDHVIAIYKQFGCFGAIGKTNHAVLRYREPIYRTLRELALSFFHEYFLDNGKKTLREYSVPVNLKRFNKLHWRTSEKNLFEIPQAVDDAKHFYLFNKKQEKNLRKADKIEIQAGKLVEWKKYKSA